MRVRRVTKTENDRIRSDTIPREVHEWLKGHMPDEQVVLNQYADLHGPGHFGDAWVIGTDRTLIALRWDARGLRCQVQVPLEDVERLVVCP